MAKAMALRLMVLVIVMMLMMTVAVHDGDEWYLVGDAAGDDDDLKMEVDVINPKLAQILQSKYGFHKVGDLGPDRVLMSLNESKKNKKDVSDEIHLPELSMKKKDLLKSRSNIILKVK